MKPRICFLLCLLCLAARTAPAQADRFELGQRLRACEAAWDTQYNGESRRAAVLHLQQAVQLFFGFKLSEAARELDAARMDLRWPNEPTPFARWAESLFVKPDSRLFDAAELALPYTVNQAYQAPGGIQPQATKLRLTLLRGKQVVGAPYETKLGTLPLNDKLLFKGLAEADYTLRHEILLNNKLLASSEQTISVVSKLKERLEQLQKSATALPQISTDGESARALVNQLEQLAQKAALETNLPAARLLAESEHALREAGLGRSFYGQRKTGQFWLTLVLPGSAVPVRLLAPAAVKSGARLPLVIAMHGAGGSENMFFDGYGQGKIATLSEARGWLLVSPRGSPGFTPNRASQIIDAIDKLYPVDRQRVFVLGHSMGASQAIASASATPNRFAAVAALGGGGSVKESDELIEVPFFVCVGVQDFGYSNARKLAFELKKANVRSVRFREYPDVEHLVIVQEALPDVFGFFDEMAQRKP
ncbi:MAG: alpha/beta fold hydrolase [Acidobacteria bacterium]|nr:alpha/beta fold hydrolase [Acidobacteriota bacterium]MBI3425235.1 alpha/beta fold hydrolase [Acidobacteriota bacterium]